MLAAMLFILFSFSNKRSVRGSAGSILIISFLLALIIELLLLSITSASSFNAFLIWASEHARRSDAALYVLKIRDVTLFIILFFQHLLCNTYFHITRIYFNPRLQPGGPKQGRTALAV